MKNLRRDFERFCYRHQNKGIHNLMLYIAIGTAAMYLLMLIDPSQLLYRAFCFDRYKILHGQIWRLFTYIIIPSSMPGLSGFSILFEAILLFFYYRIGLMLERQWGVFRFNLFYLTGVVLIDLGSLLMDAQPFVSDLNLSLILAFATLYPENRVYVMYIIPLKMKYLAWFYFAEVIFELFFFSFPYNLLPLIALLNYFLFFGSSILGVLPDFMQRRGQKWKPFGAFERKKESPNPNWASGYRAKAGEKSYRHKCTVCGRTDTDNPGLEFRYCSKCNGYYCYCIDHINNHAHIP